MTERFVRAILTIESIRPETPLESDRPMNNAHILIIAQDASVRAGLNQLVSSIPAVTSISTAPGGIESLDSIPGSPPDLVVLDASEDPLRLLGQIQERYPRSRILLFVESVRQQTQAQVAGADVVLLRGFPAQALIETMQALLHPTDKDRRRS
jgi:DNA-binding NarL/FixJ family response regulator